MSVRNYFSLKCIRVAKSSTRRQPKETKKKMQLLKYGLLYSRNFEQTYTFCDAVLLVPFHFDHFALMYWQWTNFNQMLESY